MARRERRKAATNLFLDPEVVARGEAYAKQHGLSVSQIVNSLLGALPPASPDDAAFESFSPVTRRLYGIARVDGAQQTDEHSYREHLSRKYVAEGE